MNDALGSASRSAIQNRRLYIATLALCTYILLVFLFQQLRAESDQNRVNYVAAAATIPSRFHQPMSHHEIQHLVDALQQLETGGKLSSLGLAGHHPALNEVLAGDRFDMAATLELLEQKRLRPARAKLELMVSKLQRIDDRRARFDAILSWVTLSGALLLLCYASYCLWRARSRLSDEIVPLTDDEPRHQYSTPATNSIQGTQPLSLISHFEAIVAEESRFSGFHAKLETGNFNESQVDASIFSCVRRVVEQLLRNSVEHGGRSPDLRLLAGKPEFLQIDLALTETNNGIQVVLRDDGEGIDEKHVLHRALDLGLISSQTASEVAPGHGIKYIFVKGYSEGKPRFGVADNSIGLDQVRQMVKSAGGSMLIGNQAGKYCQFTLLFPSVLATD